MRTSTQLPKRLTRLIACTLPFPAIMAILVYRITKDENLANGFLASMIFISISLVMGLISLRELAIAKTKKTYYNQKTTAHIVGYQKDKRGYEFPVFEFRNGGINVKIDSYFSANPEKYPIGSTVTLYYNKRLKNCLDVRAPELESAPDVNISIVIFSITTFAIGAALLGVLVKNY